MAAIDTHFYFTFFYCCCCCCCCFCCSSTLLSRQNFNFKSIDKCVSGVSVCAQYTHTHSHINSFTHSERRPTTSTITPPPPPSSATATTKSPVFVLHLRGGCLSICDFGINRANVVVCARCASMCVNVNHLCLFMTVCMCVCFLLFSKCEYVCGILSPSTTTISSLFGANVVPRMRCPY